MKPRASVRGSRKGRGMGEPGNAGYACRTVIKGAAVALALSLTTGCWCTGGVWKWAAEPLARSRAACVTRAPEGGEQVLFRIRECPDRPDGWYALGIPDGWREQSTRASVWGSDVLEVELEQPVTSLVPVARADWHRRAQNLLRLDFQKVADGWRPPEGSTYGVIHVPGKDRYAAAVFGYDASRGRWVELARAPLDPGRKSGGRAALAVPATFFANGLDFVIAMFKVFSGLFTRDFSFEMPRYKCDLPRLIEMLDDPSPVQRVKAARRLRVYGAHGKPAVPALKSLASGGDADCRLEALRTLHALSALDASTLAAMLRTEDVAVRRDAALFLGEMKSPEAADHLVNALQDADPGVRRDAATALGQLGQEAREAVPALLAGLRDDDDGVRAAAAKALGRIGPDARESVPALRAAAGDDSRRVRRAAAAALESIGAESQE